MVQATRTVNPLPLQDLEPHRFEDLVRQLAYGFRTWRRLEATGRLGADEGTDILGVEIISPQPAAGDEEDYGDASPVTEREWRIQCKREKQIGAAKVRRIVREAVPDPASPPYGLVVAAACDVSAATMLAYHQEARARGVVESHLWTRAHLEDLLFLPDNDRLLFAYFGISLAVRHRSRLQLVRHELTIKRKIKRALDSTHLQRLGGGRMLLVRDVGDEHYPRDEEVPDFHVTEIPPWHPAELRADLPGGMLLTLATFDGWVRPDGSWDVAWRTLERPWVHGAAYFQDAQRVRPTEETDRVLALVPERERARLRLDVTLAYERALEVDSDGDHWYQCPHLYCEFHGNHGPYTRWLMAREGYEDHLDIDAHQPLFQALQDGTLP